VGSLGFPALSMKNPHECFWSACKSSVSTTFNAGFFYGWRLCGLYLLARTFRLLGRLIIAAKARTVYFSPLKKSRKTEFDLLICLSLEADTPRPALCRDSGCFEHHPFRT
jgi:hypothetical protein